MSMVIPPRERIFNRLQKMNSSILRRPHRIHMAVNADIAIKITPISFEHKLTKKYANLYPQPREHCTIAVTGTALANGMRRILAEDLKLHHIVCDITNIDVPKYVAKEYIAHRLKMIPCSSIKTKGSLHVENKTQENMSVYSTSIKFKDANVIKDRFRLVILRPSEHITIKDIRTEPHVNSDDKSHMNPTGNVIYRDISGNPQLDPHRRRYHLEFETVGMQPAATLLNMTCNYIDLSLNKLISFLQNGVVHNTFVLEKDSVGHKLTIIGENHTIGNLLREYIYARDHSIQRLSYYMPYPRDRKIILNWTHTSGTKIVAAACEDILRDMVNIKKVIREVS